MIISFKINLEEQYNFINYIIIILNLRIIHNILEIYTIELI